MNPSFQAISKAVIGFGLLTFLASFLFAQSFGGGNLGNGVATKENLDLPFDARGTSQEEEEDAPEVVVFYNQQLEGNGIFYVLDASTSMETQGELAIAKREILKNVSEFSSEEQFGIIFFNADVRKFPAAGTPAQANPAMKAAATAFVESATGAQGSCCQQGMIAALQMANLSTALKKVIVYVGDGGGYCGPGTGGSLFQDQTVLAVTQQNYQRIQINCIGVLSPPPANEEFMQHLAHANQGTYSRIR